RRACRALGVGGVRELVRLLAERGGELGQRAAALPLPEAPRLARALAAFASPRTRGAERPTFRKREVEHGQITREYIDYNRDDVWASGELFAALMREYVLLGIERSATKAVSSASVTKDTLARLGIRPLRERQP